MSKKNSIFIPCEEANHTCDKTQYKESTLWEKIKLNIHLIYCKACREYTKRNAKLTKLTKDPKVDCLKPFEKAQIKESFEKELQNH
ncbi:glycine dehydrogenase [Pontimicrobium sp. IMCC45349]|jgi:predicted anti-sigma-YlaC factor YlaD|uniref:glycine dehydrogenase n=1 Tax=Pontimicrobium sp. IMCC45349 TaxID=3391574 RepID=UPI0039A00B9F